MENNCIILSAGFGKRMKTKKPKVLCEVAFKPMVKWVLDSALKSGIKQQNITFVVGYKKEEVMQCIGSEYNFVEQTELLGTGDAVRRCIDRLNENIAGNTLILCGDAPFIDNKVILNALEKHRENGYMATVITSILDEPFGYGRIVKENGILKEIVEEKDADTYQKQISEINSGAYWFNTKALIDSIKTLDNDNEQNEIYLTDTIKYLSSKNFDCGTYISPNSNIAMGANTKIDLFRLNDIAKMDIIKNHINNGVDFVSIDGVYISKDTVIMDGALIMPGCILQGKNFIGENCVIGPNTLLKNCTVGDNSKINESQVYDSIINDNVKIGPYCHIRPGSFIDDNVKIGDFVEIKNSTLGSNTSVSHLSYIGDSEFGKNINVGCGVVTVNYDGEEKFQTTVGDNSFIGCNSNLIAPIRLGDNTYVGAGSTITRNVDSGDLVVERADQRIIKGWAKKKLKKYVQKYEK